MFELNKKIIFFSYKTLCVSLLLSYKIIGKIILRKNSNMKRSKLEWSQHEST